MSWRRLAPHIYSAAKVTFTGASITLGSTVFSCYLALEIERASHQTLFAFFPDWYANVEYANGIDPELLASARIVARNRQEQAAREQLQLQQPLTQLAEKKDAKEDQTRTVFTIEGLMEPARKRVQELSFVSDLSACAMTS